MPRQYQIKYKRVGMENFTTLEPIVQANLYDRPQIQESIALMLAHPFVEGMALRFGPELFNVVSFEQPAVAKNAFLFPAADEIIVQEPLDSMKIIKDALSDPAILNEAMERATS